MWCLATLTKNNIRKGFIIATRLEKLRESKAKAEQVVLDREAQIQEELVKIAGKKDEEMKKFLEQKAKFEALYGSLDTLEAETN